MIAAARSLTATADRFRADFAAATDQAGRIARWIDVDLQIGAWPVRLSFAGAALAPALLTAIRHLPRGAGEPRRRIFLWDTASTGVAPPHVPWDGRRGEITLTHPGGVRVAVDRASDGVTLWDPDRQEAIVWLPHETSTIEPLRTALRFALCAPGRAVVDVTAVAVPGGDTAALLAGGPGVAALCSRGLVRSGDGDVLLDLTRAEPRTYALLRDAAPVLTDGLPLTRIVIPRGTRDPATSVRPVSAASALRALAGRMLCEVPRDAGRPLASLGATVRRVPCVQLRLGRDDRGPEVLAQLLAQAPA